MRHINHALVNFNFDSHSVYAKKGLLSVLLGADLVMNKDVIVVVIVTYFLESGTCRMFRFDFVVHCL